MISEIKKDNTIKLDNTVKFPEPKPIDWSKYIQPMEQVFIGTSKGKIATLIPINK
jgi:hypothetical protein